MAIFIYWFIIIVILFYYYYYFLGNDGSSETAYKNWQKKKGIHNTPTDFSSYGICC